MHTYHLLSLVGTHMQTPMGLEDQLMDVKDMDTEVGKSMYQLLQVSVCLVLELTMPLPTICKVVVEVAHHEGNRDVLLACHAIVDRLRAHMSCQVYCSASELI